MGRWGIEDNMIGWWTIALLYLLHHCMVWGFDPAPSSPLYTMSDHFGPTALAARSVDKWCPSCTLDLLTGVNTWSHLSPSPCQTPRSQTCHNQISIVRIVKLDWQQSDYPLCNFHQCILAKVSIEIIWESFCAFCACRIQLLNFTCPPGIGEMPKIKIEKRNAEICREMKKIKRNAEKCWYVEISSWSSWHTGMSNLIALTLLHLKHIAHVEF